MARNPAPWPDLKTTPERSECEVRRAEIRWYIENLMASPLPGGEETGLLRHQYEDLANHAAQGLLTQLCFLLGALLESAREEFSGTPGTRDGGMPGR